MIAAATKDLRAACVAPPGRNRPFESVLMAEYDRRRAYVALERSEKVVDFVFDLFERIFDRRRGTTTTNA